MDENPFQSIISGTSMTNGRFFKLFSATILTLFFYVSATGCAYLQRHYGEHCNSRAYTQIILSDYITSRYVSGSQVRMAVIPFSVPANISYRNMELPGLGNEMAWMVKAEMLRTGIVPIVEVLNRQDWPSKKEEFFTGNFGAIDMARDAGYDLVLVGFIDPINSLEAASASVKIIDVDSGITVWYGQVRAFTLRNDGNYIAGQLMIDKYDPSRVASRAIFQKLATCIVEQATQEEEVVPE